MSIHDFTSNLPKRVRNLEKVLDEFSKELRTLKSDSTKTEGVLVDEEKFSNLEKKFKNMERDFKAMGNSFDDFAKRIKTLEKNVSDLEKKLTTGKENNKK